MTLTERNGSWLAGGGEQAASPSMVASKKSWNKCGMTRLSLENIND
jgi:hypothetical protein